MMQYQVTRPFDNHKIGTMLDADAFVDERRACQLVDMRFLTRMAGDSALSSVPIRTLRSMVAEIDDIERLKAALEADSRKVAKNILSSRIRS
jgi:hypothetical protein